MDESVEFREKLNDVLFGRMAVYPETNVRRLSNHSTLLQQMDAHWLQMTAGEKEEFTNKWSALNNSGAMICIVQTSGWPKRMCIEDSEVSDLRTRFA